MPAPAQNLSETQRVSALQHRLAVVTMVHQDHDWARLWCAHYQRHVDDLSDLKIILHGGDPVLEEIFAGCSLIHVPRVAEDPYFEERRLQLTHDVVRGLLAYYSAVILVDIDEFICLDPAAGQSLKAYLGEKPNQNAVHSSFGVELVPAPGGPAQLDLTRPILQQAHFGVATSNYSKPSIFFKHFVGGNHHRITGQPWVIDCNVVMFHLRFASQRHVRDYIRSRMGYFEAQQNRDGVGSSGGWRNPRAQFKQLKEIVDQGNPQEMTRELRAEIAQMFLTHFQQKKYVGRKMSGLLTIPQAMRDAF